MTTPIVVSYGMGTNSTAMLVGMIERGIRPALIMAADTGDEKPETYMHLTFMMNWCVTMGFPNITVVKNQLPQGIKDGSLYNECLRLGTMPAKVFGGSSCSMKWKVEPQLRYLKKWMVDNDISFVRHFIGYDADEIHRSQKKFETRTYEVNEYPLIDWGWGRDECIAAIDRARIPRPGKSACFMCPSSKKPEVLWLKQNHPEYYERAIALELRAIRGEGQAPKPEKIIGLGRHWNWRTFAGSDAGTPEACFVCQDGNDE